MTIETCASGPRSASGDTWTMHLGDCLEGMRALADKSVDVVITDPPYSEHTHGGFHLERYDGGPSRAAGPGFEHLTAFPAADIARIARRWALVFCDTRHVEQICVDLEAAAWRIARVAAWVKPNGAPQFSGDRPAQGYEPIICAHAPGKMQWNGGGKRGVWSCDVEMTDRSHPTQKPLVLMRELVSLFSDPGELVLDPFAGSGSTGVACRQLGRRFLGWELNKTYWEIACRRLRGDEAKPRPEQPSLF